MRSRFFGLWLVMACWALNGLALSSPLNPGDGHVGASLEPDPASGLLRIKHVSVSTPADLAGLKPGDIISAIDGTSTKGMSAEQGLELFHGAIGGTLTLTIRRDRAGDVPVKITRQSTLDTFTPAAVAGDPLAQFMLGRYYEYTPRGTRDYAKAIEWYRKAAAQGNAQAQVNLGYMFKYGYGLAPDATQAATLFLKAAQQGDRWGEREMALAYYNGHGVAQSDKDAFAWFYAAARQDDAVSEQYLGFMYRKGRGVTVDYPAAFAWSYRSAVRQDPYGEWNLSSMYEHGYGVKKDIGEALQWGLKAQAALPKNESIRRHMALLGFEAFLKTPGPDTYDPAPLRAVLRVPLFLVFGAALAFQMMLGAALAYATARRREAAPGIVFAVGCLLFYVESQIVGALSLLVFAPVVPASWLLLFIALAGGTPLIAFSLGPLRDYLWKESALSWGMLLAQASTVILGVGLLYDVAQEFRDVHSRLPIHGSSHFLFTKAIHASPVLGWLCLVLLMPMAEEVLFRGFLFGALAKHVAAPVNILFTALLFSAFHLEWNRFVWLFLVGLVLGWARFKTGALRLPLMIHMANNAVVLLMTA